MEKIDILAKKIWDYMLMHQELKPADAIFALGSNDRRVANYTAEFFKQNLAPIIICSGGIAHQNDINNPHWGKPEAEVYNEILIELGIPQFAIYLEIEAKSTGDNAINIKKLIQEKNLNINSAIIVQKPFMERRAFATFRKQWPELDIMIASPQVSYDEFMNSNEVPKEVFINVMVGDLIRIKEYPKLGFQIEQDIPDDVWQAGQELLGLGYNKYALNK